jgi:hypothetical protein
VCCFKGEARAMLSFEKKKERVNKNRKNITKNRG